MPEATSKNRLASTKFPQTLMKIGQMQVINASDELFNHVDESLPMWVGEGDRTVSVEVLFMQPFQKAPAITLGIIGLDSDHTHNQRFWLNAVDIKPTGFTIECNTWGRTHIARIAVSWMAIGASGKRT